MPSSIPHTCVYMYAGLKYTAVSSGLNLGNVEIHVDFRLRTVNLHTVSYHYIASERIEVLLYSLVEY